MMFASVALFAQVTTSSISGKVTDNNRESLPGATVVATHVPSGSQYAAVTDTKGYYRLNNVRPGGPYRIEVRMIGFASQTMEVKSIALADNLSLNVKLREESLNLDEVTITAEAVESGMNSERAGAMTSISAQQIQSLPMTSRSLNEVMALTPQAATTSNGFAVGGGNYRQSYVTVDGAAFNNAFGIGSNLPAGGTPISLDALETMSVNVTPFDVRQSGFTGGAINAVTKSGTNQTHVNIYNYFNNEKLVGKKYGEKLEDGTYNELKLSPSLDNTTGISVGGAIKENKLFYFVNFEYTPENTAISKLARPDTTYEYGGSTIYNRPTVAQMDEIRSYLKETYNYDPGEYQNYSLATPDHKFLARLDWNINEKNKFNIRYSQTKNIYSSNPSSSINPLSSSVYNRNTYGRTSEYALHFQSSRYYQEQNFSSFAAELNTDITSNLKNTLRATYSHQNEPRSFDGGMFPTVDIIDTLADGTRAVLTSFGPDPFTYGNLRDVNTIVATDEVSYATGRHNIIGGIQYEHNKAINGFMQGGAGYYVYGSWNDFTTGADPIAFAITYGNNDKHEQVFPYFNYNQFSAYAQDEVTVNDNLKVTVGLRAELPMYPSTASYNTNAEFDSLATIASFANDVDGNPIQSTIFGLSTADMPTAKLSLSPRIGFNYDVLGDRSLILRGGTGIYNGRLPMVWIVSAVGNSNCMQNQYISSTTTDIDFYSNVNDIINNNSSMLTVGDLPAPQSTTLMDKNLVMPRTWKTSLAVDAKLPFGIKASVEGIYNKDLVSVAVTKLGLVEDAAITLTGEPEARTHYTSEGIKNTLGKSVTPYLITNSKNNGYYYSITGKLEKNFNSGLNLMAAYTRSEGKNVTDGIGDQITSAYNTNTFGVNGSNAQELGYSSYVSPNRLLFSASYRKEYANNFASTVGMYYEGYNHCYVGSYSYTRYSYTLSSNVNGDGGSNSLIYCPTDAELDAMPFSDEDATTGASEGREAFRKFIEDDAYLSSIRGQYSERGGAIAPMKHTINFKFMQDFYINTADNQRHTLQLGIDVKNIANLLNPAWGNIQRLSTGDILKYNSDGTYTFNNSKWGTYASTYSTWSAMFSVRYMF